MQRYNPLDIEPKWQQFWDENGTYVADLNSDKTKYFSMSMFNYPSGNLHIGHSMNFTISDVMARFKRQQGYETYHPVGWDSFGLPAENRAIKEGVSPQESMRQLIPAYHKAYKAMGWSNDWSKEIASHEPEYYKWTQWIFAEMYKAGLAYQDSRMQWWCDIDKTVLSNEQVIDGKCWRHDGPDDPLVEKREIKQWFFKITDYAEEMLDATDALDWTESVKLAQKNWFGKSVGAEIDFELVFDDEKLNENRGPDGEKAKIRVFTTRPDTLFGATFLVLAPEHRWVELALEHGNVLPNNDEVAEYVKEANRKSELERMETKDKTGVQLKGVSAINPATGEKIPLWTADYVLYGYGTGAIMAVPAHDERDQEFAEKFDLPIIQVVDDDDSLINSGEFDGQNINEAREKIVEWLEKEGIGQSKTTFKIRDWSVSRQRYWGAPIPIINCPTDGPVLDENLPVVLPELVDFAPAGDGRSALARADDWLHVTCPKCGGDAERETDTLDTYICSSWYFLRYLDPHDADKIFDTDVANKWMPVDFYNGGDHATAHMIYARFVTRFLSKQGLLDNPEPFKRFLFNGKVTASDGTMFSKSKGNGVDPLEIISSGYGADALRTYLMFAAPLDIWIKWDAQGVPATYRFLNRVWNLVQEFNETSPPAGGEKSDAVLKIVHPTIKKVTADLEDQKYNTAIAAMMKLTNDLYELKVKEKFGDRENWKFTLESLVALVAPFAPFIAEELWHQLGHDTSVHRDSWPQWEDQYLVSDTMTIVVQVNGKLRAELKLTKDTPEEDVKKAALEAENVVRFLDGKEPLKVIYIPAKIVNIVVK